MEQPHTAVRTMLFVPDRMILMNQTASPPKPHFVITREPAQDTGTVEIHLNHIMTSDDLARHYDVDLPSSMLSPLANIRSGLESRLRQEHIASAVEHRMIFGDEPSSMLVCQTAAERSGAAITLMLTQLGYRYGPHVIIDFPIPL